MEQNTRLFVSYVRQRKAKTLDQLREVMDLTWLARKDYRIINTQETFNWAIDCIKKAPIISIDTETTGLNICNLSASNPLKDKVVGMSISWKRDQGIYIPFEHACFANLPKKYVLTVLKPLLETKSIVTHNGLFDGKVFYDEGIRLNITQDTMLLYFNMDSTVSKGSKGLKALTTRRYGYAVIELSDIFESESDAGLFQYVEYELTKAYACADSDHTLMLFMDSAMELLPGQIKSYRLDVRVQNHLIRSEYFGKGINMDLLRKLNQINSDDLATLELLIYQYTGGTLAYKHFGKVMSNMYRYNLSSSQDLVDVLFYKIGYEIPQGLKDKGKLSVDKYTLRALRDIKSTHQDPVWDHLTSPHLIKKNGKRLLMSSDGETVLLDWDKIGNMECKLAHMITKYRKLEKLRSAFFHPLLSNNYESKYFSGIKMTRAETARLVDFIQTLDKSLKKLIVPLEYSTKKQYLMDFDFAQIEYRVMAGEAGVTQLVERLNDPEADYHREGGSLILDKPPEDITGDERSNLKSINFGIPYGMSDRGILQNRFGIGLSKEETEIRLAEIQEMLRKWESGLYQIKDMLNRYRDKALTPVADETLPSHLKGKSIGRIANVMGRTRLFNLEDMSNQKRGSIRRQAGNYPIQSFAREVYCIAFCDFCDACIKAGLMDTLVPDETKATGYRFENKVNIMAYIHDECLMSVDADVNHEYLYKLIYENCMKHIPGYPRFYCGINVINNWYEGKDDKYEAPVGYVKECVDSNPPIFVSPDIDHKAEALKGITDYVIRRVQQEFHNIDPRTDNGFFDMRELVPKFKNYFVKPKVAMYIGLDRKPSESTPYDDFAVASIESYSSYMHSEPIIVNMDGTVVKRISNGDRIFSQTMSKESEEYRSWVQDQIEYDDISWEVEDNTPSLNRIEITDGAMELFESEYSNQNVTWQFKQ